MYGYIYKITNKINGKIYVGKRVSESFDSSYWGSGKIIKKAIEKYGIENFDREILQQCDSDYELNLSEKYWISELDATNKQVGYNLTSGGTGGNTLKYLSDDEKSCRLEKISNTKNNKSDEEKLELHNKLSKACSETQRKLYEGGYVNPVKGRKWYNNGIEDKMLFECPDGWVPGRINNNIDYTVVGEKLRGRKWYNNGAEQIFTYEPPNYVDWVEGMLNESIEKSKKSKLNTVPFNNGLVEKWYIPGQEPEGFTRGRLKENIDKGVATRLNNGYKVSDESKSKISDSVSKLWSNPDYRKLQSERHKGYIPSEETKKLASESQKGRKVMHKDNIEKRVKSEDLDEYINNGWEFGRLQRN